MKRNDEGPRETGEGAIRSEPGDPKQTFQSTLCEILARTSRPPLVVLDKDGTITHPRKTMTPDVANAMLNVLSTGAVMAVISGGEMYRLEAEVFCQLRERTNDVRNLSNLYLIPENGTQMYRFCGVTDSFELIYRVDLRKHLGEAGFGTVLRIINEMMTEYGISKDPNIRQIVSEGSQIKFSPLGNIEDDQRRLTFDPNGEVRSVWAEYLRCRMAEESLSDKDGLVVNVIVAGTASINILPRGVNKGHAIDQLAVLLGLHSTSVIYFGDKFGATGNDADAIRRVGVAVNVGATDEVGFDAPPPLVITTNEKGPDGARTYLDVIYQTFRGPSTQHGAGS